jgi:hypothetical protein
VFGTQTLTESGEYTETFISKLTGCDSIVTLTFTVAEPGTVFNEITETACGSYEFNGEVITESGEYTYTVEKGAVTGADSVINLLLTINPIFETIDEASVEFGGSYVFGTQTLTETGVYTETFQVVSTGCDSTVTLTFTVLPDAVVNPGDTIEVAINENPATGDVITTLPDTTASGDTLTYTISDTTNFEIVDNQIIIKEGADIDAENDTVITVVVIITNGDEVDTAVISIPVIGVNEMPEVNLGDVKIAENQDSLAAIVTLPIVDQDGDTLTYALVDSSVVTIVDGKLVIVDSSAFDAENGSVTVELIVTDGTFTDTIDVVINVENVNEFNPVFTTTTTTYTIAENLAKGTVVATIAATDADGETLTFSLTDASGAFAIDAATGVITVVNASILDYETNTSFTITVNVTDGTNTESIDLTISLTDVEEGTGIDKVVSVSIYPTVVTGTCTVDADGANGTVTVYTSKGVLVSKSALNGVTEIDFSGLAAGVYNVYCTVNGKTIVEQVIVK